MLNVIVLSVAIYLIVMLNVIMLTVVILNVVMLSVVAHAKQLATEPIRRSYKINLF